MLSRRTAALLVVCALGAGPPDEVGPDLGPEARAPLTPPLRVDAARRALLALLREEGPDLPNVVVRALERGEERDDGRYVVIGERWTCDLDAETFVFFVGSRGFHHLLLGVFEWDPAVSSWRARVTYEEIT